VLPVGKRHVGDIVPEEKKRKKVGGGGILPVSRTATRREGEENGVVAKTPTGVRKIREALSGSKQVADPGEGEAER